MNIGSNFDPSRGPVRMNFLAARRRGLTAMTLLSTSTRLGLLSLLTHAARVASISSCMSFVDRFRLPLAGAMILSGVCMSAGAQVLPPPTNLRIDTVACTAPAYTPGGSDGRGGCFPGPANTGVPTGTVLTNYTGSCTITAANTVIDAKTINCNPLQINAANVTLTRSKINGSIVSPETNSPVFGFTITDSELDCQQNVENCINGSNWTARRVNAYNARRIGYCYFLCTLEYSYLHGTQVTDPTAHVSAFRLGQYTTLHVNTIWCDAVESPQGGGCSADLTGYPDFTPIHHNTVDGNLFPITPSGGACSYGGWNPGKPYNDDPLNATYVRFVNNVYQTSANWNCGAYGPTTSWGNGRTGNEWTNNVYYPGGAAVPADSF
jgi:hypothetical protein